MMISKFRFFSHRVSRILLEIFLKKSGIKFNLSLRTPILPQLKLLQVNSQTILLSLLLYVLLASCLIFNS